jgi:hypothetical protein
MRNVLLFPLLAVVLWANPAFSDEKNGNAMTIATGYGGVITNEYNYRGSKLKDSGFMGGLYLQYVDPSAFQVNGFFYHAPDVNYSKVYGAHINGDAYFMKGDWGSLVAGLDVEYIRIRLDAEDNISPLQDFRMNNDVLFSMARAGAKFNVLSNSPLTVSLFPYAGATRESVKVTTWTDMPSFSPMMPDPAEKKSKSTDTDWYPSWGVNMTSNFFHFVELTVKYLGRAQKDNYMNSFTAQLNVYPARNFVVSYQFKYMDVSADGKDSYHLLGAGALF